MPCALPVCTSLDLIANLLKVYHVQVNVPTANVDEILPAARLLSRATAVAPIDYERAKTVFLQSVQHAGLAAKVVACATSAHSWAWWRQCL